MRVSELSARTGVSVATIKYYRREGLLPEGVRSAATQATYDDAHVSRLRVIRALIESGASIAETRTVLDTLDRPPARPQELLGAAHAAITPSVEGDADLSAAERLVGGLGWQPGSCDPYVLSGVARALETLDRADFQVSDDLMAVYLDAIRRIARAEIAGVPADPDEAVRYVVLGSVLIEPLLLALRRVAEQVASVERFAGAAGSATMSVE